MTREMDEFDSENQNATKIAALYNPNHEPEHRLYGESIIPRVALAAPKTTDVFWTTPSETRNFLALDPYFGSKNRPGVKAATALQPTSYVLHYAMSLMLILLNWRL